MAGINKINVNGINYNIVPTDFGDCSLELVICDGSATNPDFFKEAGNEYYPNTLSFNSPVEFVLKKTEVDYSTKYGIVMVLHTWMPDESDGWAEYPEVSDCGC